MSLVNDMLRDLDARQAVEDRDSGISQPLTMPSRGDGRGVLGGIAVALLFAGFIAGYVFIQQPQKAEAPSPAQAMPTAPAKVPSLPAQEAEPPLPVTQPAQTTPEVSAPVAANDEAGKESVSAHTSAVEQLLAVAEQALAEDRLTQPPVNNAYALYSHVLLLAPDNQNALAGVERVQARYEQLVREAVQMQDRIQAQQYLQRAALVGMPAERLAALRAIVQEPVKDQLVAKRETAQAEAVVEPASGAPVKTHALTIEKSWPSREADAVAKANRLLQQGRQGEAIATLQPVVSGYSKTEAAALLLFDIYLSSGGLDQARSLQSQVQSPVLKRYFEAKLLTETGRQSDALALMEQQNPVGPVTEPWLALQAALYQQAGAPEQALALYQRLVQMDREQVTYWLGLGVAAETAGQPNQALQAFVAANQLRSVNTAVSSYIKQRIQALSR